MIAQCPKLYLSEMQKNAIVLGGLLQTEMDYSIEMRKQLTIIETEMYQLQVMIVKYFEIKNCKVNNN